MPPPASQYIPQSVAVIEDDPDVAAVIKGHLEDLSIKEIEVFEDGEKAWHIMEHKKFDLVTLDWNLPTMSGLALLNRLRARSPNEFTPILLISGYLGKKDFSLLEELPFTNRLQKPFVALLFRSKVTFLVKEAAFYNKQFAGLGKLIKRCAKSPNDVMKELLEFTSLSPRPTPFGIEAVRTLIANRHFEQAEILCTAILKREPDSLMGLSEMGKILLHLKEYDRSLAFLEKARAKSPQNTERLCAMGNAQLQKMDIAGAELNFKQAAQIDPQDEGAMSGLLLTKNVLEFTGQDSVTSIPDNFASLLNAIGVSMVKNDRHEQGIEHYQSALKYTSDDTMKSRLAFNCGLGFMRWRKEKEALTWFQKAVSLSGGTFEKATNYVKKIEAQGVAAAADDKELQFQDVTHDDDDGIDVQDDDDEALDSLDEGIHKKSS